jgi:Lar family restriction alleviation protein
MNKELKPCPFCGGDNIKVLGGKIGKHDTNFFVVCKDCSATSGTDPEKTNVIEAWNRRVTDE